MDILFSEGPQNMNWANVMGEIKTDLELFVNDGGWSFL